MQTAMKYSDTDQDFLSGQELYDALSEIRKSIHKRDLSSQFRKYLNHLDEQFYNTMPSKTRIMNTIASSGGKTGMGWDKEHMTNKLKEDYISMEEVKRMVLSLENELKDPCSEFHKLACNTLTKERFSEVRYHVEQTGTDAFVFGDIITEIPINKYLWDVRYDGSSRLISRLYHECRIGISPKKRGVMPDNFYIRKVA